MRKSTSILIKNNFDMEFYLLKKNGVFAICNTFIFAFSSLALSSDHQSLDDALSESDLTHFFQSAERECSDYWLSENEGLILNAYLAYYGRPADLPGLTYWAGRLESGAENFNAVLKAFSISEEYDRRFGELDNHQLISRLYQQMFNREPEQQGLNFYVGLLESGERSPQSIALDIFNGARNTDHTILQSKKSVSKDVLFQSTTNDFNLQDNLLASIIKYVDETDSSAEKICTGIDAIKDRKFCSTKVGFVPSGWISSYLVYQRATVFAGDSCSELEQRQKCFRSDSGVNIIGNINTVNTLDLNLPISSVDYEINYSNGESVFVYESGFDSCEVTDEIPLDCYSHSGEFLQLHKSVLQRESPSCGLLMSSCYNGELIEIIGDYHSDVCD